MLIIVSLILLGILMMLIEILLTPGVGVPGILGLGSLAGSCWYAFDRMGQKTGFTVTALVTVLLILMLIWILRAKTWKRFELKTVIDGRVNEEGDSVTAGTEGVAVTRLGPMGNARFGEVSCEVASDDGTIIDAGTPIVVTRTENKKIFVKQS